MAGERKRPWYLVLALLGALALGTTGAYRGWVQVAAYHAVVDPSAIGEGIVDEHERAVVEARLEAVVHALDQAKSRGWPLGVAMLLLGGAMVFMSLRAIGGSGGARVALVQLALAQAGVTAANHFLLQGVNDAEARLQEARAVADEHALGLPVDGAALPTASMWRAAESMFLVLRSIGSALVVIGLTRRKSRDFFDAAAAAIEER